MAIWKASSEYSVYYTRNEGSNFLVFWENLDGFFKLSTIAVVDGAILLAIFGMTVFSDFVNRKSSNREELERMHEGLIVSVERGQLCRTSAMLTKWLPPAHKISQVLHSNPKPLWFV
jgi:hypothetical protein